VSVPVGVIAPVLTLLMVIDVSEPEGDWHLPKPKSRSTLGVRSNRLCRLLSEGGCVVVPVVVMARFPVGSRFDVRDSSETSGIIGRHCRCRVSNRGDLAGTCDDGEGSGC